MKTCLFVIFAFLAWMLFLYVLAGFFFEYPAALLIVLILCIWMGLKSNKEKR